MSKLPSYPEMLRKPWLSFALLTLLGDKPFVDQSYERIKTINRLRIQGWEKETAEINHKEREFAEKKRQDELERRLGWGYSFPYQSPQNTYVIEYKGMQITRSPLSTGHPVMYNGEIIQVS